MPTGTAPNDMMYSGGGGDGNGGGYGYRVVEAGDAAGGGGGGGDRYGERVCGDAGDTKGEQDWLGSLGLPTLSNVVIAKRLGSGAFGDVYLGSHQSGPVAVKVVQVSGNAKLGLDREQVLDALSWELTQLSGVSHHNVVRFLGVWMYQSNPTAVMEFCSVGELDVALARSAPRTTLWRWILEAAQGLGHLHSRGILHRDLKGENLLIDECMRAKLADLGVAGTDSLLSETQAHAVEVGLQDIRFMSPQRLEHRRRGGYADSTADDIYAFGLMAWQLARGVDPRNPMREPRILEGMKRGEREEIDGLQHPESFWPSPLKVLIKQCWSYKPEERPSVRQVVGCLRKLVFDAHPQPSRVLLLEKCSMRLQRYLDDLDLFKMPPLMTEDPRSPNYQLVNDETQKGIAADRVFDKFLSSGEDRVLGVNGDSGSGKTLLSAWLAKRQCLRAWQIGIVDECRHATETKEHVPSQPEKKDDPGYSKDSNGVDSSDVGYDNPDYATKDTSGASPSVKLDESNDNDPQYDTGYKVETKGGPSLETPYNDDSEGKQYDTSTGYKIVSVNAADSPPSAQAKPIKLSQWKPQGAFKELVNSNSTDGKYANPVWIPVLLRAELIDLDIHTYSNCIQIAVEGILECKLASLAPEVEDKIRNLHLMLILDDYERHSGLSLPEDIGLKHWPKAKLVVFFNSLASSFEKKTHLAHEKKAPVIRYLGYLGKEEVLQYVVEKVGWTNDERSQYAAQITRPTLHKVLREPMVLKAFTLAWPVICRRGLSGLNRWSVFECYLEAALSEFAKTLPNATSRRNAPADGVAKGKSKDLNERYERCAYAMALIAAGKETLSDLEYKFLQRYVDDWLKVQVNAVQDLTAEFRNQRRKQKKRAILQESQYVGMKLAKIRRALTALSIRQAQSIGMDEKVMEALRPQLQQSPLLKAASYGFQNRSLLTFHLLRGMFDSVLDYQGSANEERARINPLTFPKVQADHLVVEMIFEAYASASNARSKESIRKLIAGYATVLLSDSPPNSTTPGDVRANTLMNLGERFLGEFGDPETALKLLLKANAMLGEQSEGPRVSVLSNIALCYRNLGNTGKALQILFQVLNLCESHYGKDHYQVGYILENLAGIFLEIGQHQNAVSHATRALRMNEAVLGENHVRVSDTLLLLACVPDQKGLNLDRKGMLERAMKIRKSAYGPEHIRYAQALEVYAGEVAKTGNARECQKLFQEALAVMDRHYGVAGHWQTGSCLANYGAACLTLGDAQTAKTLILKALNVTESHFGNEHISCAGILEIYANVLSGLGDYKSMKEVLKRALKIKVSVFGPDHLNVASVYRSLGGVLQALGELSEAREAIFKSLEIQKKCLGPNSWQIAFTMVQVAKTLKGDIEGKIALLQNAVKTLESRFGPNYAYIGNILTELGNAALEAGKYQLGVECHSRAVKIIEATVGKKHWNVALAYGYLANAYGHMGDNKKKKEMLLVALEVTRSHFGENHPQYGFQLNNLAGACEMLGEREEALRLTQKALKINEAYLGPNHVNVAINVKNIGCLTGYMGDAKKMLEFHNRALKVFESSLGSTHPTTADTYADIGIDYMILGDMKTSIAFLEKSVSIFEGLKLPFQSAVVLGCTSIATNPESPAAAANPYWRKAKSVASSITDQGMRNQACETLRNLADMMSACKRMDLCNAFRKIETALFSGRDSEIKKDVDGDHERKATSPGGASTEILSLLGSIMLATGCAFAYFWWRRDAKRHT